MCVCWLREVESEVEAFQCASQRKLSTSVRVAPAGDETECVRGVTDWRGREERREGNSAAHAKKAHFLTHVLAAKGVFDAPLVAGMQREG